MPGSTDVLMPWPEGAPAHCLGIGSGVGRIMPPRKGVCIRIPGTHEYVLLYEQEHVSSHMELRLLIDWSLNGEMTLDFLRSVLVNKRGRQKDKTREMAASGKTLSDVSRFEDEGRDPGVRERVWPLEVREVQETDYSQSFLNTCSPAGHLDFSPCDLVQTSDPRTVG